MPLNPPAPVAKSELAKRQVAPYIAAVPVLLGILAGALAAYGVPVVGELLGGAAVALALVKR